MAEADASDLEQTIRIGAALDLILRTSQRLYDINRKRAAAAILKGAQAKEIWQSRTDIYPDISKLTGGRIILHGKQIEHWTVALNQYLAELATRPLKAVSIQATPAGEPQSASVAQQEPPRNPLQGIRYIDRIPANDLAPYRIGVEEGLGLSQFVRLPPNKALDQPRRDMLTGAWRMFRVVSESEVFANLVFFRADRGRDKFERLLVTQGTVAWDSTSFVGWNDDVISVTTNGRTNALSLSVFRLISHEPLVGVGVRLGQGPETENGALPLKGELIFGFRIHSLDFDRQGFEDEFRSSLAQLCERDVTDPARCIDAAVRALTRPDLDDLDALVEGFRANRIVDGTGQPSWRAALADVRKIAPEAAAIIEQSRLNGVPLGSATGVAASLSVNSDFVGSRDRYVG